MVFKVQKSEKLIKFLIHNIQGMSFANAQKLMRLGKIKVNGKREKENISLIIGDQIDVFVTLEKNTPKVDILYSDDNILIVNKPQGIECAKRDKSSENTITLEEITAEHNGIIVHRLDRLTEGLVILARNTDIARKFEKYFREGKISKYYKAFVYGKITDSGIKTAYLKKDSKNSKVTISDTELDGYKKIITEYKPIAHHNNHTLLDINLHTGRTHQIRGYFSHIGHPILNDTKYSDKPTFNEYKGYFLTSYKLKFNIDDELSYLNDLNIEITPSWLKFIDKV
jgi:23S rRNA pseudouridine955/2504/2580 synthase